MRSIWRCTIPWAISLALLAFQAAAARAEPEPAAPPPQRPGPAFPT